MYLLLLTLGSGIVWLGVAIIQEEVFRLAAALIGAIVLVWGFSLTPIHFQLLVEILLVGSVFSVCLRCWQC